MGIEDGIEREREKEKKMIMIKREGIEEEIIKEERIWIEILKEELEIVDEIEDLRKKEIDVVEEGVENVDKNINKINNEKYVCWRM